MALSRIALLLGVSRVAGFSTLLTPRSGGDIDECTPPECAADSKERCKGQPMAYGGQNKKVCSIDGFCYLKKGSYCTCDVVRQSCAFYPGSSHCTTYEKNVAEGACPPLEQAGAKFCLELEEKQKLPSGTWCGSLESEGECNDAYITYTNGPTEPEETFQSCFWDTSAKKCKKYKKSGYDVVVFCNPFCEDKPAKHDLGTTKCNGGRLDDYSEFGLPNRLRSESACTGSYTSPNDDTAIACEWLAGTSRCDPEFYCDDPTDTDPETGSCFPACNCQNALDTGDRCTTENIMCCDSDECITCPDGADIPETIYNGLA